MSDDPDDCELCDGCGEVSAYTRRASDGQAEAIACPLCLQREKDATIAALRIQVEAKNFDEEYLRTELWQVRQILKDVRLQANAGRFKDFGHEPWLVRVRNIDLNHDPVVTGRILRRKLEGDDSTVSSEQS